MGILPTHTDLKLYEEFTKSQKRNEVVRLSKVTKKIEDDRSKERYYKELKKIRPLVESNSDHNSSGQCRSSFTQIFLNRRPTIIVRPYEVSESDLRCL